MFCVNTVDNWGVITMKHFKHEREMKIFARMTSAADDGVGSNDWKTQWERKEFVTRAKKSERENVKKLQTNSIIASLRGWV